MKILKREKEFDVLQEVTIIDKLEPNNYELSFGAFGRVYLEEIDPIKLPKKIYSNDKVFIDHVSHTWEEGEGNLGICLVGEKGLGKSLTGNIIAKNLNLPVIRITDSLQGNSAFKLLNEIKQDFCLFIDEFEKLFSMGSENDNGSTKDANSLVSQEDFLSFLDGGSVRENRIVFIITSNSEYKINSFLKNRPSRIKYFKIYKEMEDCVIREVIDDLLINKEFSADLLENIPYEGLNTDVLIQIIKEINFHKKPYSTFKDFFNFRKEEKESYFLMIPEGKGKNPTYKSVGKVSSRTIYEGSHIVSYQGKAYYADTEIKLDGIEKTNNFSVAVQNPGGNRENIDNCYLEKENFEKLSKVYSSLLI